MTTENLSTLKIHKLTQTQYNRELSAGNIDEFALYLTPDDHTHTPSSIGAVANSDVATVSEVETYLGI